MGTNPSDQMTSDEWSYFLFGKHSDILNKSHFTGALGLTASIPATRTQKISDSKKSAFLSFSAEAPPSCLPQLTPELWRQCEELERFLPSVSI